MPRMLLIGLLLIGGVLAVWDPGPASADSSSTDFVAAAAEDGAVESTQDTIRPSIDVTVRPGERKGWTGKHDSVSVSGKRYWGRRQSPVPDPVFTTKPEHPGKVFMKVNGKDAGMTISAPGDEGTLFRIHVDRPNQKNEENKWKNELVVIGFYDSLGTAQAVNGQAYSCKKCGRIMVCGVDPVCEN